MVNQTPAPQCHNQYCYCVNSPISSCDPDGTWFFNALIAGVAALIDSTPAVAEALVAVAVAATAVITTVVSLVVDAVESMVQTIQECQNVANSIINAIENDIEI